MRTLFALIVCLLLSSSAFAQQLPGGLDLGIGLSAPVSGGSVITAASVDDRGIVHADTTLDASAQLLLTIGRPFRAGALTMTPALGLAPKFALTGVSNTANEQAAGAGLGWLLGIPGSTPDSPTFNLGVFYMTYPSVSHLDPSWVPGFQAPRDSQDDPMAPRFSTRSPTRVVVGFVVGNVF